MKALAQLDMPTGSIENTALKWT